jgi:quercetin dioxygenase-like cupin family protein
MDTETAPLVRSFQDFRWADVERGRYKEDGAAPFKAISRQVLFNDPSLACELRYFEMAAGGHSTLERHKHMHAVMILRGRGQCLLGETVRTVQPCDLISIPAWTWHQFRATEGVPFGFLCMVNQQRDKPLLPTEEELAALTRIPEVSAFLAR